MRTIIYSLRELDDKTILSIDLGKHIVSESFEAIQMELDEKIITIQKSRWVNTMKVFDSGTHQFLICSKRVSRESAFSKLIGYSLSKMETMNEHYKLIKRNATRLVAA